MKTLRVLVALAVMVVIVGATEAVVAGGQMAAVGRAKPADKAPAQTGAPATKRAKKQEQAAKSADKPADKAPAPQARAARKKPQGDKPLEAGKNGGSRTARKKSA